MQHDEDGWLGPHGRLDADHGAVLDAALSEARDRLFRDGIGDVTWVDALVDIAERSLDRTPVEAARAVPRQRLRRPRPTRRRRRGSTASAYPRRSPGCAPATATISPVFVADARPVSVGRSQRIVPERTRRVVLHRDKKCRNPLCAATRGLEVHHVVHWRDWGETDTRQPDRPVPALPPRPPPRPPRHLRQRRSARRHHVPRRARPDHRPGHPRQANQPDRHPSHDSPTGTPSANACNAGRSNSTRHTRPPTEPTFSRRSPTGR